MTKEQFISLLKTPSTINLNMVKGLEEITERFPYFQNAHLLLAKQYQGHQNIRYESYLRKAAAYASDRRLLYELIQLEPEEIIHIEPEGGKVRESQEKARGVEPEAEIVREGVRTVEPMAEVVRESQEKVRDFETEEEKVREDVRSHVTEDVRSYVDEEIRDADIDAVELKEEIRDEEIAEDLIIEQKAEGQRKVRESQEDVREDEVVADKTAVTDPKEIIAKRLRELEQSKEVAETVAPKKSPQEVETPAAKIEADTPVQKTEPVIPPAPTEKETINEAPEEPEFVRVRKEPREPREPRDPKLKVEEQHSFLEWLKLKDMPVIPAERVSEYFKKDEVAEPDANKPGDQLIDQFIKTEPRIVPARSEFYSPGNMARQSAIDHEDMISETLARIYAKQGNIPKAIDAYKRLSLKIPEKSSYFAALIKELENNEQS